MHVFGLQPEKILYLYMASCVAVLLFNLFYIFIDKHKSRKLEKRSLEFLEQINIQLHRLDKSQEVEASHLKLLEKKLRRVEKMRAFEISVEEAGKQASPASLEAYLKKLRPVFIRLISVYEKRDVIEQAYYVSLIDRFGIDRGQRDFDGIIRFLVRLCVSRDVYVRENSLQALFSIGNGDAVLAAWEKMESNQRYHSGRLLSEGLLRYSGDKIRLSGLLFSRRKEFSVRLTVPVLQFMRRYTGDFQEEILELLKREEEEKELRLEAVRYFRKYPYEPARELLQRFVWMWDCVDWEYSAMAGMALSSYAGTDTVECLKEGLRASNWYVRRNCALSLIHGMKIPSAQLYDVYNGKDRYAREILRYVEQKAGLSEEKMELME